MGIFVPILPTTVFLLIASGCYARSSERLYGWMMSKPWLRKPVETFMEHRAMPLKAKVFALFMIWSMIGWVAVFKVESRLLDLLLVLLALVATAVILALRTLR